MTSFFKNIILVLSFVFFATLTLKAQNLFLPFDTITPYSKALDIINGEEWKYTKKYAGHPFFINDNWNKANIEYNGLLYRDVDVKYDIETDDLILFVKKESTAFSYKLNKQFLSSFQFYTEDTARVYVFHYIQLDKILPRAFYTKLYEGGLVYYVRFQKYVNNVVNEHYTGEYLPRAKMFLEVDAKIYELRSKRHLLSFFEDKKRELKKFFRKQHIKFDPKNPEDIVPVFEYYDSLHSLSKNTNDTQR